MIDLHFRPLSTRRLHFLPFTWRRLVVGNFSTVSLLSDLGQLKKLRIFECCRTLITYIPLSLSKCVALEEVNLNDNQCLYEVPAKLLSLPKLGYIYVDRTYLNREFLLNPIHFFFFVHF